VRASHTRGEPPSFARRGPSRAAERSEGAAGWVAGAAGLETLPGFPLKSSSPPSPQSRKKLAQLSSSVYRSVVG
jgi:hypothetical protein